MSGFGFAPGEWDNVQLGLPSADPRARLAMMLMGNPSAGPLGSLPGALLLNHVMSQGQRPQAQPTTAPQGQWVGGAISYSTDPEGNPDMNSPLTYAIDPEGNPIMQRQWQPSMPKPPQSGNSGGLWNWLGSNLFSLGGS